MYIRDLASTTVLDVDLTTNDRLWKRYFNSIKANAFWAILQQSYLYNSILVESNYSDSSYYQAITASF